MTGQFLWLAEERAPCPHTRVRVWSEAGEELRFVDTRSFGQMWWVPAGIAAEAVMTGLRRLGPEPFGADFTGAYLRKRLKGSRRPIKNALLDQSLVAGVGNIYADESLFTAGILPQTPSGRLGRSHLERLRSALVDVLETSIGAGGTTFSDFRDLQGTNGKYGGQAWVYRRSGSPCRRCGTVILREKLGGAQQSLVSPLPELTTSVRPPPIPFFSRTRDQRPCRPAQPHHGGPPRPWLV